MAAAHFNLALALEKTEKFKEAVNSYRRYIKLQPNDPDGYYSLAGALESLENWQESLTNYQRYIQLEKRPSEKQYIDDTKQKVKMLKKHMKLFAQHI